MTRQGTHLGPPDSDQLLEKVYALATGQSTEVKRAEVARAALAAAQYRAQQLARKDLKQ